MKRHVLRPACRQASPWPLITEFKVASSLPALVFLNIYLGKSVRPRLLDFIFKDALGPPRAGTLLIHGLTTVASNRNSNLLYANIIQKFYAFWVIFKVENWTPDKQTSRSFFTIRKEQKIDKNLNKISSWEISASPKTVAGTPEVNCCGISAPGFCRVFSMRYQQYAVH